MFRLVLAVALLLMHAYVCWRIASLPAVRRHSSGTQRMGAAVVVGASWLAGLAGPGPAAPAASALLEWWSMTGLGTLFLFSTALLAVDVASAGMGFLRRRLPALRGAALLVATALTALALVQGGRAPVVTRYDVRLARLPPALDGLVVVALSDLHLGRTLGADWLAARVAQVHAEHPDLVVLTGDIVEGREPLSDDLQRALAGLAAPLGVWAVGGNHERYAGRDDLAAALARVGIGLLEDRWVALRPGLVLVGLHDISDNRDAAAVRAALSATLARRPAGATLLLSHAPPDAEVLAGRQVDLVLAGHTHGGQLWPFGWLVQRIYPFLAGRYDVGGTTLVVSRGTGTWGPRMRLWRPAEILRVTLRAAPAAPAAGH